MPSHPSPPAHITLDPCDLPHWRSIVAEFPPEQWSPHQLDLAAILARMMADLEREQRLCKEEGLIIIGTRGGKRASPRGRCINGLVRQITDMRKSLGLAKRQGLPSNAV